MALLKEADDAADLKANMVAKNPPAASSGAAPEADVSHYDRRLMAGAARSDMLAMFGAGSGKILRSCCRFPEGIHARDSSLP
jgi:hypothetical protein